MLTESNLKKLMREIENCKDIPVIVEGIRDKRVLSRFGFKRIITISGKSLEKVGSYVAKNYKEVIILTDFDKEGRKKSKFLKKFFEAYHVKTVKTIPRLIKSIFRISKIEELKFFVKHFNFSEVNDLIKFNRSIKFNKKLKNKKSFFLF
jgi:5S rRNA maturation endonuclease (ribonuclease M5)